MEDKPDDLNLAKCGQFSRLLKQADEMWISSEELNTENSSDDDCSKKKKTPKRKVKRKRSTPNIKLERVPGYTTTILPSLPSRRKTSLNLREGSGVPRTERGLSLPSVSSAGPAYPDRLDSLESWRPMKGALASCIDTPETNSQRILNEVNQFHEIMFYKLKLMKSRYSFKTICEKETQEPINLKEEKTFKYLKNTPEVQEKLKFISNMEERINSTYEEFKVERAERLATEQQVCRDICQNRGMQERDTNSFLQFCNFNTQTYSSACKCSPEEYQERSSQESESNSENELADVDPPQEIVNVEDKQTNSNISEDIRDDFIKRNIFVAKEGVMAGFSLTDEQKVKIEQLLKEIDNFELKDGAIDNQSSVESGLKYEPSSVEVTNDNENVGSPNAFSITETDKTRIKEIDSELEKLLCDQEDREKLNELPVVVNDDEFWKQYLLDQSLKDVDQKLETLYKM